MGGPVADDMGPVAVPRHRAAAVCLGGRGPAVLRTAKLPRSLALQDRIVASRRRPGALPSPGLSAPATGILPSGLRPQSVGGHTRSSCRRDGASPATWRSRH